MEEHTADPHHHGVEVQNTEPPLKLHVHRVNKPDQRQDDARQVRECVESFSQHGRDLICGLTQTPIPRRFHPLLQPLHSSVKCHYCHPICHL